MYISFIISTNDKNTNMFISDANAILSSIVNNEQGNRLILTYYF